MKNTQKKLKAKHFRYLSKENIEKPKEFLSGFFERIDLEYWQEKIYVFLSSGSVQRRYPMHDSSFVHQKLIEQVEYAYILYYSNTITSKANRLLDYIFEIQSLSNWREQLDSVLRNQTDKSSYFDDGNYDRYLINLIELTHYLVKFLFLYANNRESYFTFPYYILPTYRLNSEELIIFMIQLSEEDRLELSVEYNNPASIFPEIDSFRVQQNGRFSTLYYVNSEARKNPLHAILESLSIFTLCQWQEILYDWLEYGLSTNPYTGNYFPFSGTIYQTLIKTLEISYLIAFKDELKFLDSPVSEQQEM